MNTQIQNERFQIYDDLLYICEMIEDYSNVAPEQFSRALMSMARLKVFVFALSASQCRAILSSNDFKNTLDVDIERLTEEWPDLKFEETD